MANDTTLDVRRLVIRHLRADTSVTAVQPASRIYPPQVPANPIWPFTRYESGDASPRYATGMDGAAIPFSLHVFARGPGEDRACTIGRAIAASLDGAELVTERGDPVSVTWNGSRTLPDPEEADAWHVMVECEALVVSAE